MATVLALGGLCAGCCGDDVACTEGVYGSSVIAPPGPLDITVTVCRNGSCDSRRLFGGEGTVEFHAGAPGHMSVSSSAGTGPWNLWVTWVLEGVDFDDGDRYRVSVFDRANEKELFDVEHSVAYQSRCYCDSASLQLPDVHTETDP